MAIDRAARAQTVAPQKSSAGFLWRLLALAALLGLMTAAAAGLKQLGRNEQGRRLNTVDDAVVAAAIADLIERPDTGTAGIDALAGGEALFSISAVPYKRTLDDFLREGQLEPAAGEERDALRAAAQSLIERSGSESAGEFRVRDPRVYVHLKGATHPGKKWEYSCGISACAPGFSANGMFAVVRLYFPSGDHGGHATFLLVQENRNWKVRQRKIYFH